MHFFIFKRTFLFLKFAQAKSAPNTPKFKFIAGPISTFNFNVRSDFRFSKNHVNGKTSWFNKIKVQFVPLLIWHN